MPIEVFRVLEPGVGATIQDRGRAGWRRFGVPPSGAMDDHAAGWANRLLHNPPRAPVLELLMQGARLEALCNTWIVVAGADASATVPLWKNVRVRAGEIIEFPRNQAGLWIYLAVEGGFAAATWLGSASAYPRGNLGKALQRGDVLSRNTKVVFQLPASVAGCAVAWDERRTYDQPPPLHVWPGPQWNLFEPRERAAFFDQEWTVSAQSDRVGYRLEGTPLKLPPTQIISEPVCVGTIQVPASGLPIVTMRDGPTVGGYFKLGVLAPTEFSWLAQCRPGRKIRFAMQA